MMFEGLKSRASQMLGLRSDEKGASSSSSSATATSLFSSFSPRSVAASCKAKGNEMFARRDFAGAIDAYTEGIDAFPIDPSTGKPAVYFEKRYPEDNLLAVLHSNRSAALVSMEPEGSSRSKEDLCKDALRDAEQAIALEPTWPKAYSRKGNALSGLKKFRLAAKEFAKGMAKHKALLQAERSRHEKELAALKAQASSQVDEYLRLMNENKSLKRQLEDFNLVLGNQSKKLA